MNGRSLGELYRAHLTRIEGAYGRAIDEAGYDALVIHSGAEAPHSSFDDQHWPLRPTPAFTHWLPLCEADALLVIRPGARPQLIRTVTTDFWEGAGAAPEQAIGHAWPLFTVTEVGAREQLKDHVPAGRVAFIGDDRALAGACGIAGDDLCPPALMSALDAVRRVKSEYEIHCIREANRRAGAGHAAVQCAFADEPRSELELHLLFLAETGQDALATPYQNIVAVDGHAATLHHVRYATRRPGTGAHSLLVNAGASCFGYAADVTRTIVRNDDHDPDAALFGALVTGVGELQEEMCRRLRPGVAYEALHDQAHELLAALLCELGVGTASAEALVDTGVTRALLPHGLGHSLGLQVHDVGCRRDTPRPENPFLRTTITTEPDMVFTIEPGCYFIEALLAPLRAGPHADCLDWGTVDRIARFGGVRIEDDLRVTAGEAENLTRPVWPQS